MDGPHVVGLRARADFILASRATNQTHTTFLRPAHMKPGWSYVAPPYAMTEAHMADGVTFLPRPPVMVTGTSLGSRSPALIQTSGHSDWRTSNPACFILLSSRAATRICCRTRAREVGARIVEMALAGLRAIPYCAPASLTRQSEVCAAPASQWPCSGAWKSQQVAGLSRRNVQLCGTDVITDSVAADTSDALLLRAVRGDEIERPPVWLMRQAGRYMKVYQKLCEKYPTFRERSENVDIAVEVSLQPWRAFKPDGVILFSDILTPLTGMNIPFDILKSKGPVIHNPIRTAADVAQVRELVPGEAVPYVGEALTALRAEVGNASTVLGFVGAPFTLASYIVEGGSSKHFTVIKRLAFESPEILHSLLQKLAKSVIIYTRYQADNGAQAVQIFDSWATHLSPKDFEVFSLPYIKQIVQGVKSTHPDLPVILYASGSGGLLERMATSGVDVISLDWTVDMAEARQRIGHHFAVQGNVDPGVLFGSEDFISQRIHDTVAQAGSRKHILNLGHGVLLGTSEAKVAHFFEVAKSLRY